MTAIFFRINRILEAPRGNALLVGVGGSGKQSLSRLSSFISSLEVFQVQLRKGYGINDLKADLGKIFSAYYFMLTYIFIIWEQTCSRARVLV